MWASCTQGKIVIQGELDDFKSDIHKFQIAYAGEVPEQLLKEENILYRAQHGSVISMIVNGNREAILSNGAGHTTCDFGCAPFDPGRNIYL